MRGASRFRESLLIGIACAFGAGHVRSLWGCSVLPVTGSRRPEREPNAVQLLFAYRERTGTYTSSLTAPRPRGLYRGRMLVPSDYRGREGDALEGNADPGEGVRRTRPGGLGPCLEPG